MILCTYICGFSNVHFKWNTKRIYLPLHTAALGTRTHLWLSLELTHLNPSLTLSLELTHPNPSLTLSLELTHPNPSLTQFRVDSSEPIFDSQFRVDSPKTIFDSQFRVDSPEPIFDSDSLELTHPNPSLTLSFRVDSPGSKCKICLTYGK